MIFTPKEWYDMAAAAERLAFPTGRRSWQLSELCYRIATIDDPYYSRLAGSTYRVAAGLWIS